MLFQGEIHIVSAEGAQVSPESSLRFLELLAYFTMVHKKCQDFALKVRYLVDALYIA